MIEEGIKIEAFKRTRKNRLPEISREHLESAVKEYLEGGGQITQIAYVQPKQKNEVYSVESTVERHTDVLLDEVPL